MNPGVMFRLEATLYLLLSVEVKSHALASQAVTALL